MTEIRFNSNDMTARKSALRFPLNLLLGSEARVSILRELALNGREVAAPQLVVRTRFAQSSIREALQTLVAARVVEAVGSGRSVVYRLDHSHPIAAWLVEIFLAEEARYQAILASIGDAGLALGERVEAVWVFGSVAKGSDDFASDLDIAIVAAKPDGELAAAFLDVIRPAAERLFFRQSVIVLDRADFIAIGRDRAPIIGEILANARTVIGPSAGDYLARLKLAERSAVQA